MDRAAANDQYAGGARGGNRYGQGFDQGFANFADARGHDSGEAGGAFSRDARDRASGFGQAADYGHENGYGHDEGYGHQRSGFDQGKKKKGY